MRVTVPGRVMIPMIKPKNTFLSFQSYGWIEYAVKLEK